MTRTCGDCTLCCRLVPVQELNKPAGQRCVHQRATGCRIYPRRPLSCRYWNCRWLVDPDARDLSRPDRVHYVIDLAEDFVQATPPDGGEPFAIPVIQVWVDPKHPDAHEDPGLRRYLEAAGRAAVVRYSSTQAFILAPPSLTHDGRWHIKDASSVDAETHARHAQALGIEMTAKLSD